MSNEVPANDLPEPDDDFEFGDVEDDDAVDADDEDDDG